MGKVILTLGDRRWRIRGLQQNTSYAVLRVNVMCSREDHFHVDTLDVYSARHRASFLKQAALELGVEERVLKTDMGRYSLAYVRVNR